MVVAPRTVDTFDYKPQTSTSNPILDPSTLSQKRGESEHGSRTLAPETAVHMLR